MATEMAVTIQPHVCQAFFRERLPAEPLQRRAIPYMAQAVLVEIAHRQTARIAGEDRTIHFDMNLDPAHVTGHLFPYLFARSVAQNGVVYIVSYR